MWLSAPSCGRGSRVAEMPTTNNAKKCKTNKCQIGRQVGREVERNTGMHAEVVGRGEEQQQQTPSQWGG